MSLIIAIELPGNGLVCYEVYERYTSFYDQYVRNRFGSYRNLLKGVSFNVMNSNQVLDEIGNAIDSYTIADIMSYACV